MTSQADYSITEIQPGWVLASEAMGSKNKFWFRDDSGSMSELARKFAVELMCYTLEQLRKIKP